MTTTRSELISPGPAEALAGLLDIATPQEVLPPTWHWVYLVDRPSTASLGQDGHPESGVPAPRGPGYTRMFAGGRVTEYASLRFGAVANRTTDVVDSATKQGRSGPLTFVTVRHTFEQEGQVCLIDEQDIVYRKPGMPRGLQESGSAAAPALAPDCLQLRVDNLLLFRFSALTYNGHRIHYDLKYAAQEGYPGLVVHGPLQALLLREHFRRVGAPNTGHQFSYRLVTPTYANTLLTVRAQAERAALAAQLEDSAGRVTAMASLARSDRW